LIPAKIGDAQKKQAITDFLRWMMTAGQEYCAGLAYAPLPKPVVAKEMKAISRIQ
jgi:phosphate transport system substrate-binding protein